MSVVPGDVGIANRTAALVRPDAGAVFEPLRYFQSRKAPYVDGPAAYTPIQSLGFPGPLVIVAVTVPPGATVVALTVNTVLVTVIGSLVIRSAMPA